MAVSLNLQRGFKQRSSLLVHGNVATFNSIFHISGLYGGGKLKTISESQVQFGKRNISPIPSVQSWERLQNI